MSGRELPRPKTEPVGASANWLEIDRSPHAIQFYAGEDFLLDSLSRFVSTALEGGDSCFVLATPAHLDGLADRLKARGVNTNVAARQGLYGTLDSFHLLEQLMVDGKLSKTRFDEFISEVLMPLKAAVESKRVAVCGELAGLLWAEGKVEAAIELEHCWNELAKDIYVRCFYPVASFSDPGQNELFLKLCAEHASVIPPAKKSAPLADEERLRNLAADVRQLETAGR